MNIIQKIVVRTDLNMRKGKLAAQVAHASNEPIIQLYRHEANKESPSIFLENRLLIEEWWDNNHTKIVLGCSSEEELKNLIQEAQKNDIPCYPIIDMGFTEFHGIPTLTCCGLGPYHKEKIDIITNMFKLL